MTLKILVAGLGAIGQRHLRNLRTILGDTVQLSAFRRRGLNQVLSDTLQIEAGVTPAEKYGLTIFTDLSAALADRPDAVFICTPSSHHLPLALVAAEAGCHLFIEKPLADTYAGAEQLADLVDQRGLTAVVGYQMRFHPCLLAAQALLAQGGIGQPVAVRAEVGEYLPAWHTYENYRQTYGARRDLGGGAVLSQIHEIDYLLWLFGPARRVFSLGGHLSNLEIDVEDVASTLLECTAAGRVLPIHLQQDYLQRPPSRTLQVVGDEGKLLIDFRAVKLTVFDPTGQVAQQQTFADFQRNDLFLNELRSFLAQLQGQPTGLVTVRADLATLRTALAMRASIETRQAVDLR